MIYIRKPTDSDYTPTEGFRAKANIPEHALSAASI